MSAGQWQSTQGMVFMSASSYKFPDSTIFNNSAVKDSLNILAKDLFDYWAKQGMVSTTWALHD